MRLLLVGLAASLILFTPPLLAGPNDNRAAARALANEGFAHYEAGRYDEAIKSFAEAERLFHAPTLIYALGKAHARAGKLLAARDLFRRVVDEPLPRGAPDEFRGAQSSAKGELALVEARIPSLEIAVAAPRGKALRVSLDDAPVAAADLGKPLQRDPGAHVVVVAPSGGVGLSRSVELKEGDHLRLEIELPSISAPSDAPVARLVSVAQKPEKPGSRLPAMIAFGAGAAALAVGAGTGIATLVRASEIKSRCPGGVCPSDLKDDAASAKRLAAVSTIGFIVAGAGAATGVVLVLTRKKGETKRIGLAVGPAGVALEGVFQ